MNDKPRYSIRYREGAYRIFDWKESSLLKPRYRKITTAKDRIREMENGTQEAQTTQNRIERSELQG